MKINTKKTQKVSKGQVLLHAGDICTNAYKVEVGCLRSYVIDKTGKEHILQFAPEDWLIADLDSLTNQKKSMIFIDVIEDSTISLIHSMDYTTMNQGELITMTTKFRNNLIATNKRVISLLSATAEERYLEFTRTYPTLIQRLPLKLIASYIGITPEYLSDVRRKLAKK